MILVQKSKLFSSVLKLWQWPYRIKSLTSSATIDGSAVTHTDPRPLLRAPLQVCFDMSWDMSLLKAFLGLVLSWVDLWSLNKYQLAKVFDNLCTILQSLPLTKVYSGMKIPPRKALRGRDLGVVAFFFSTLSTSVEKVVVCYQLKSYASRSWISR